MDERRVVSGETEGSHRDRVPKFGEAHDTVDIESEKSPKMPCFEDVFVSVT